MAVSVAFSRGCGEFAQKICLAVCLLQWEGLLWDACLSNFIEEFIERKPPYPS
jgi:hypothetical protein